MGVPPAKLHEKPPSVGQAVLPADTLSAGPAAWKAAWFFEPVGMGLRPAKAHEKRWGRRKRLPHQGHQMGWVWGGFWNLSVIASYGSNTKI
jgi:hypothetical protein